MRSPNEILIDILSPASRWDLDTMSMATKRLGEVSSSSLLPQKRVLRSAHVGYKSCGNRDSYWVQSDKRCYVVFTWQLGEDHIGRQVIFECGNTDEAVRYAIQRTAGVAHIESVVISASFGHASWTKEMPVSCEALFDLLRSVPVDHLYLAQADFIEEQEDELRSLTRKGIKQFALRPKHTGDD